MIVDKKTYQSPFCHAIEAERFGADDIYQHLLAKSSFDKFLGDVFEQKVDLRDARFEVVVHEDGLFCTVARLDD